MSRARALAAAVLATAVVVCGLAAPASYAGKKSAAEDLRVQRVTVAWNGTAKKKVFSQTAVVPGIGTLTLVCRPNATLVRLRAHDRSAETQMWMAKYETKNDRAVVAVKTARIYRYATAADDGRGGTGQTAAEGLNQRGRIENHSSGHINGVISQRPGRHRPAAGAARKPVTSFDLSWWWTGFEHPMAWRACRIDAVVRTRLDTRVGVSWHGLADAGSGTSQTTPVPGIGELRLRCEPEPADPDGPDGDRSISIAATSPDAWAYVETVQAEGLVEHQVDDLSVGVDPETGLLGPFPLPRNGMMRLFLTAGGVERRYIVSSYHVVNNAKRPELNLCEVSAAEF
ncbi:hypothetical protein GGQ22_01885 [Nocardioides sp. zg-579]|uniref:Uncharacterized protein n=1 Tax=Nocardioides marmotae TaxID=2663857 RepID=A0A6I3J407_9ACTN|nr:hypothetical protein [Nocardioides marmotae]MCR6030191.1 hypothetical protein [Gordonia jinghuaiqii]MTB93822.1 hypothetical protein [Nocardioides marmotae]QKE00154.1 hypothetical protein HPC71_02955 [Nocardioides marmotae]